MDEKFVTRSNFHAAWLGQENADRLYYTHRNFHIHIRLCKNQLSTVQQVKQEYCNHRHNHPEGSKQDARHSYGSGQLREAVPYPEEQ